MILPNQTRSIRDLQHGDKGSFASSLLQFPPVDLCHHAEHQPLVRRQLCRLDLHRPFDTGFALTRPLFKL